MDINQLVYFLEVCECKNISNAAESLHLSQQGVSMAIRRLEKDLECNLFFRKNNGVFLTEEGKFVQEEAKAALYHIRRIGKVKQIVEDSTTTINVAMTGSVLTRMSAKLQQLLLCGTEDIKISMMDNEAYSSDVISLIKQGHASMGFVFGEHQDDNLDVVTLYNLKQVFIVNQSNPLAQKDTVTIKDLDGLPFIAPDEKAYPRKHLQQIFNQAGAVLNVAYTCNRPLQTIELIANNPILVARAVVGEVSEYNKKSVKALTLDGMDYNLPIQMITKKDRLLNSREKLLKNLILSMI